MKRMLCAINTSIWICCKTCYKTTKALYFYCTLCGPASGFHKAVSVYHTWLSNNPVVGQTQLYPEDRTPEILYWSRQYTSLSYRFSLFPNLTPFVLSLYYIYTDYTITYTLYSGSEYLHLSSCILNSCQYTLLSSPLLPEAVCFQYAHTPSFSLLFFTSCPHVNPASLVWIQSSSVMQYWIDLAI